MSPRAELLNLLEGKAVYSGAAKNFFPHYITFVFKIAVLANSIEMATC